MFHAGYTKAPKNVNLMVDSRPSSPDDIVLNYNVVAVATKDCLVDGLGQSLIFDRLGEKIGIHITNSEAPSLLCVRIETAQA